jgi:hypothetical protein
MFWFINWFQLFLFKIQILMKNSKPTIFGLSLDFFGFQFSQFLNI